MKLIKNFLLLVLTAASLVGCTTYDSKNWTSDFNQGSLELQKQNYSKAEELRKLCLNEAGGDRTKELLSLSALARVYRTEDKADQSIEVSKDAIRKAIAYGDQNSLLLAQFMMVPLTKYYEKLGRGAEIPKLKDELKLPEVAASPIADKQQPYLTKLATKAMEKFGPQPAPGKKVVLVLMLTPEAAERVLYVAESSGDSAMDGKACESVQACQPFPAFLEKPEHDVVAIISFGSAQAPQAAADANQPAPHAEKLPSPDQVPPLPEKVSFPILPDEKSGKKK